MERKTEIVSLVTTLAVLLGSAAVSFAQPNPQESGKNTQMQQKSSARQDKFLNSLNLTAEQKEKIKNHRQENKGQLAQLRQQLREKRQALKAEFDKTVLDKAKTSALVNEIKSLSGGLLDLETNNLIFLKETLTAEQFAKFRQKMKERSGSIQQKKMHEQE